MGKPFLVEYNGRPSYDYIHCRLCRTRVAFVEDYIAIAQDLNPQGVFNTAFNVEVPEDEPYHRVVDDKTIADAYCVNCGDMLGWKLIAVSQCKYYKEGQFLLILEKLSYWNDQPLVAFDEELVRAAYEQARNDQVGSSNQQVSNEQDEENADQDLGANGHNADQYGDANGQDSGTNEENADQDEDSNGQDLGAHEENADQDEDSNGQNLGAHEENADQDEDSNGQDLGTHEENADQDGGDNEQVSNQHVDIAEGMGNIDLNANT